MSAENVKPLRSMRAPVLLSVVVLIATLSVNALGAGSIHKPDYQGHFVSDPNSGVQLKLFDGRQPNAKVRVGVTDLKVFCDGGGTARISPKPINARFTGRKTFKGERYFAGQTKQVFYQVRGRFFSRGRVTGTVLYIDDLINQQEGVPPGDCSTQRRATWRAGRTEDA